MVEVTMMITLWSWRFLILMPMMVQPSIKTTTHRDLVTEDYMLFVVDESEQIQHRRRS
jgi:hypothetical protein